MLQMVAPWYWYCQVMMKTKCRYHSCLKGSVAANKVKQDEEENASTGNDEGDMQPARKSDVPVDNKLLASDVGQKDGGTPNKDGGTPNKKRKVQSAKVDSNGLGLMAEDREKQKIVNDSDLARENDERAKKKRKVVKNEKKNVDAEENKDGQDEAKDASIVQDLSARSEQV